MYCFGFATIFFLYICGHEYYSSSALLSCYNTPWTIKFECHLTLQKNFVFRHRCCYACLWNQERREKSVVYRMQCRIEDIAWPQMRNNMDLLILFIYNNNDFINYKACWPLLYFDSYFVKFLLKVLCFFWNEENVDNRQIYSCMCCCFFMIIVLRSNINVKWCYWLLC